MLCFIWKERLSFADVSSFRIALSYRIHYLWA